MRKYEVSFYNGDADENQVMVEYARNEDQAMNQFMRNADRDYGADGYWVNSVVEAGSQGGAS